MGSLALLQSCWLLRSAKPQHKSSQGEPQRALRHSHLQAACRDPRRLCPSQMAACFRLQQHERVAVDAAVTPQHVVAAAAALTRLSVALRDAGMWAAQTAASRPRLATRRLTV